ncbi:ABC transporter substrate-binding protein [Pararhizobium mangrovi]|uniref:ABC transporter substrate-binding protein n=1 Tax=Pararhizobium mangrovi TaxID=2590452 RepID=A0A506UA50_9HYPH|nr:ABC transporter substrate-binding protein [Pararhizobium mangrovi]TPW31263.1 ABC transporter substrate-binding protein [Pararhizobium mangrovi]
MKRITKVLTASLFASVMASAVQAQTLVYCSEGSPEGFDPALYTTGTTFDASSRTIYNRLVEFKHGSTELTPGLAKSWDVSDDGTVYTFHLRDGVKFGATDYFKPSRDMNADDVVFSFNRQLKDGNPWHDYANGTTYTYFSSMGFDSLLKKVEKVDDKTVKFTLSRPSAPFLADLAMDFSSIMSKEYADQLKKNGNMGDLNQKPVGTGPFTFVAYQPDAVIRYKANPDYWDGKQKLDNLVFAITPEASVRTQKLKSGECQIMPYPNAADVAGLKKDDSLQVLEQPGLNIAYLAYNVSQKPFDNVKVRKALNMAVDKKAIVQSVFQGMAQVATNPIPPTMWSYNKSVQDDPYDPDKAKQMLADAGVKNLKMNIWAMPVSRPYMLNARRAAEIIQADFKKIGVTANIVSYEWGEYIKRAGQKDHDGAVMLGWTGDNGDPDNFLNTLLGCDGVGTSNNVAEWCDKDFQSLVDKAARTTDKDERVKLYQQAQKIFKQQAPWMTIDHSTVIMPMSKKVQGFQQDPLGFHRFDDVSLSQ